MKKIISFDKEILFPTMIGEITAISLDQTLKFLSKNDIEGDFIVSGRYKMTEASAIEEDFKHVLPIEITLLETFTLETTKIDIKDFYYEVIDEEILKVKIDIQIEGVEEVLLEEEKEEVVEAISETEERKVEEKEELISEVEIVKPTVIEEQEDLRECDSEEKTREEKLSDVEPVITSTDAIIEEDKLEVVEPVHKEEKEESVVDKKTIVEEFAMNQKLSDATLEEVEVVDVHKQEKTNTNIQSIFRVFNDAEETYRAYTVYIMRKNDSINSVLDRYQITKEQLEEYNDLSKIELGSKVIIPTTND